MLEHILKKHARKIFRLLLLLLILTPLLVLGLRDLSQVDFLTIIQDLEFLSLKSLVISIVLGLVALSYSLLYDYLISRYLQINFKSRSFFPIILLSNSLDKTFGHTGQDDLGPKKYIFQEDLSHDLISQYRINYRFGTRSGLAILFFLNLPIFLKLNLVLSKYQAIFLAIGSYLLLVVAYLIFNRDISRSYREDPLLKLGLLALSTIHWTFKGLAFYLIFRFLNLEIPIRSFMAIFILSKIIGSLSLIPSGFGSFDLSFLLFLKALGYPAGSLISSLLIYRFSFYIIPIVIASLICLIFESKVFKEVFHYEATKKLAKKTSALGSTIVASLILSIGLLSIFTGFIPGLEFNFKLSRVLLPKYIVYLSNPVSIGLGLILIFLAREIKYRVKRAYKLTFLLISFNIIISSFKYFSLLNLAISILTLMVLMAAKEGFYRTSLPRDPLKVSLALIKIFIALYIYTRFENIVWKELIKSHFDLSSQDLSLALFFRNLLIYGLFGSFIFFYEGRKKTIFQDTRYELLDLKKLEDFVLKYGQNYHSPLAVLGDKALYYYKDRVLIQFSLSHNFALGLGDPIGDPDLFKEALDDFYLFLDQYGYRLAFYQTDQSTMALYHNKGYSFFKLGEMALVDLEDFSLESPKARSFRNTLKRFTKDGYLTESISGRDLSQEDYLELASISKAWLKGRKEMGFSLGSFNKDYLENSQLMLVKELNTGKIVGFTSVNIIDGERISIDLMRYLDQGPKNLMTNLILNVILHYKDLGFKELSLDMAPLSNVGTDPSSHKLEKMAHLLYNYGSSIYSFKGLRAYKEKFKPTWVSKYLTYKKSDNLPLIWLELSNIIRK